jgi:IS4 transposase
MILDPVFDNFLKESPVSVALRATMEHSLPPESLDALFHQHARQQYEDQLLFSTVVATFALVVGGIRKSVLTAYKATRDQFSVSVTSLYNKLQGVEPQVSQALVRLTAQRLQAVQAELVEPPQGPLANYRLKILDGNHLAATEHRLRETRLLNSAPLPGQALVVLDPRLHLVLDVFPCEDAYAQERSLLPQVLETVEAQDLWIADRNFCTTGFLFGLRDRGAFFLIRQHGSTLSGKRLLGSRRLVGRCATGMVYEQTMEIENPEEPDPERRLFRVRRITLVLDQPTEDGDTEIHVLTNVPAEDLEARAGAALYRTRWTIESAFQELDQALEGEINTLCYPRAALLAFCLALYVYNVFSVLKAAICCEHRESLLPPDSEAEDSAEAVGEAEDAEGGEWRISEPARMHRELSGYYVSEEFSTTYRGMMIAIPAAYWRAAFGSLSASAMAACLRQICREVDVSRFRKSRRGPKKDPPKRTGGYRQQHVSTQRLLDARTPRLE